MADRNSSVSGVAERYASAFFDLARDESAIDRIETDLTAIEGLLDESADFRRLDAIPQRAAGQDDSASLILATMAVPVSFLAADGKPEGR